MTIAETKAQAEQWRDTATDSLYCKARVFATRDYRTHQITVQGHMGIAPDSNTIILYPISIYRFGYWNKANIRKQMAEVKRELKAAIAQDGYRLTEPLEVQEIRF